MANRRVYIDHSATTPVDERVLEQMLPYFGERFGNASSVHGFGQDARAAVDRDRRAVAALVGAKQTEIVFVSGGTEANNLALRGICEIASSPKHIITSSIEHPSVRGVLDLLEKRGWQITRLPVYEGGLVKTGDLSAALRDDTLLVTVMVANNEMGTIQPIRDIGNAVRQQRERGQTIWFLSAVSPRHSRSRLSSRMSITASS